MAGTIDEQSRLERLLGRYGGDPDVIWAVEKLSPRHSRIARRDAAVRAARTLFPGVPTASARALAAALGGYFCSGWPAERDLSELHIADPRRRVLHEILRLNGGRPLAYRRIMDIFK